MNEQTDRVRELVRERYAAAATMATTGAQPCCCDSTGAAIDVGEGFGAELYDHAERGQLPAEAVAASLDAATRSRLPNSATARRCSTWAPAAASTCCSPPAGSARREGPTGWT